MVDFHSPVDLHLRARAGNDREPSAPVGGKLMLRVPRVPREVRGAALGAAQAAGTGLSPGAAKVLAEAASAG